MHETKLMHYTKDNGDKSSREVIVVSEPRTNYLVYDVTKLNSAQRNLLLTTLDDLEQVRKYEMDEYEVLTGIKLAALWRSFKPGGIEWLQENERKD